MKKSPTSQVIYDLSKQFQSVRRYHGNVLSPIQSEHPTRFHLRGSENVKSQDGAGCGVEWRLQNGSP